MLDCDQSEKEETGSGAGGGAKMPELPRKNDLVCWVFLSEIQQRIYEDHPNTKSPRGAAEIEDLCYGCSVCAGEHL